MIRRASKDTDFFLSIVKLIIRSVQSLHYSGKQEKIKKGKSRKLRANLLLHCTNQCVIKAMINPCFDNKVAMDQIVGKFNTFSGVARFSNKLRMF